MSQIGKPPCDDAAILYGVKASPCSVAARRWTLLAAILGSSMAFVDGTVVNVALPAIQRDLNADAFAAQWVVESAVLSVALAGAAGLLLFGYVEATRRDPMLPLALFRMRNFAGANLLTLLLYAALGGGLFFLPLNLIQVQGYGATAAGAALLPFIVIMFALSRWAGQLVDRFGSKIPLVAGPAVAAVGFALFAVPGIGGSYWLAFFPAVCVLGLGMSVTVAPLTTTVMNSVGADLAGVASGVNNAVSRTAALLAIAVFGGVLAWAFEATLSTRLASIEASPAVLASLQEQRHKLAGLAIPGGIDQATAVALRRVVGESFVAGFRWVMLLSAALALLSAWLLIDGRPRIEIPLGTRGRGRWQAERSE